ncbi:MAG: glycosyltransferase family 4 protein [Bacteroidetes bacterium]|nr:glycosyltransferase family 4 protein [Bacteroidota bacterium]
MRRILILTQYYPPETGAPQNRLSSLAKNLKKFGAHVEVLTAMPNYPSMQIKEGYKRRWFMKEVIEGIVVYRSWIYVKNSTAIISRLLNYFSFVFSAMFTALIRLKKYDIVICESPPLFLGITALAIKSFRRSKLVFNVSDLWPESAEKLDIVKSKSLLKLAYALEARIYKKSNLITGQTQGIVHSISSRNPTKKVHWLPNGIDKEKLNPAQVQYDWRMKNGYSADDFIVLYAGILGHAQVLDVILNAANRLKSENNIKFVLVGDGPQKDFLYNLKDELQLDNVTFFPNQPANEMPNIIQASNTAVVPLKNIPLFHGAIPSKLFENLAFSKPILLGVDGEARELFIDKGKCGLFFEPENDEQLAACILQLKNDTALCNQLGTNGAAYVSEYFDREKIAKGLYDILQTI